VNSTPSLPAVILAVGDVAPDRENPAECFDLVRDELNAVDLAFCQLETCLTEQGVRLPQARHAVRGSPLIAAALREANFGVVSFASNHCMDWGAPALLDTIAHLSTQNVAVVGAGANIEIARRPAIRTLGGSRVAFLAYCSILPMAYWAERNRPGCAPMRAWTHYEQIEPDQPGTPCRIHTYAHHEDLQEMRADIEAARKSADVVIVSMHWGIHFVPAVIADYQREVAHAAVDAGADLILGHHAHILKGFEVYRGRGVFYSIGNFAVDLRIDDAHAKSQSFREIQSLNPNWVVDLEGLYNFPEDSKKTVMVRITVQDGKIKNVGLIPACINRNAQPQVVRPEDPRFGEIASYLDEINEVAELNGKTRIEGRELHVIGTGAQNDSLG
jgi:poly-gamma-glutamate capsule biosynthesis protein CapA/YwtB (metallophosphatase superfamily)